MDAQQIFPIIDRLRLQMSLDEITMDILAAKSGFSRATLYRNFGSRQEIISSYLQKNGERSPEEITPTIPERILAAALDIFLSHGFVSATIEMIADQAGIGTATVYRYFETKENLIGQVMHALSPSENLIFPLHDENTDLETVMRNFSTTAITFMRNNRKLFKLLLFESEYLTPINQKVTRIQERTRDKLVGFFLKQLPDSPDQFHLAKTLTMSFLGLVFSFSFSDVLLEDFEYQQEQAVDWITDMMINKIGELSV